MKIIKICFSVHLQKKKSGGALGLGSVWISNTHIPSFKIKRVIEDTIKNKYHTM